MHEQSMNQISLKKGKKKTGQDAMRILQNAVAKNTTPSFIDLTFTKLAVPLVVSHLHLSLHAIMKAGISNL